MHINLKSKGSSAQRCAGFPKFNRGLALPRVPRSKARLPALAELIERHAAGVVAFLGLKAKREAAVKKPERYLNSHARAARLASALKAETRS